MSAWAHCTDFIMVYKGAGAPLSFGYPVCGLRKMIRFSLSLRLYFYRGERFRMLKQFGRDHRACRVKRGESDRKEARL